jgi:hypothetical protein
MLFLVAAVGPATAASRAAPVAARAAQDASSATYSAGGYYPFCPLDALLSVTGPIDGACTDSTSRSDTNPAEEIVPENLGLTDGLGKVTEMSTEQLGRRRGGRRPALPPIFRLARSGAYGLPRSHLPGERDETIGSSHECEGRGAGSGGIPSAPRVLSQMP